MGTVNCVVQGTPIDLSLGPLTRTHVDHAWPRSFPFSGASQQSAVEKQTIPFSGCLESLALPALRRLGDARRDLNFVLESRKWLASWEIKTQAFRSLNQEATIDALGRTQTKPSDDAERSSVDTRDFRPCRSETEMVRPTRLLHRSHSLFSSLSSHLPPAHSVSFPLPLLL